LLTLENPDSPGRTYLTLNQGNTDFIPQSMISATLATADPTFWQHGGYSFDGILSGDHPTLAQKLVSDLLGAGEEPGLRRYLRERLLAAQITARFGRDQILIWYLNSANFGRLAYGVDSAARLYFDKPASQLRLAESAQLAAVLRSPALNPLDAPAIATEQAGGVITEMVEGGWISALQAEDARRTKLDYRISSTPSRNLAPAFINLVLEQAGENISLSRLERGGFRVITSLDYDLQLQAVCTLQAYLDHRMERTVSAVTISEECPAARLLPTTLPGASPLAQGLLGNLIILDHRNGEILAMVGEITPGLDPAHTPGHSPGSLLTPFIYLTGFTRGLNPGSLLWDIPTGSEQPLNLDGTFHGPIRLRTALVNDDLIPAATVLNQIGPENAWRLAAQFGLRTAGMPQNTDAQALLEEGDLTLLEASRAYGAIANQGVLVGGVEIQPVALISVQDYAGRDWIESQPAQIRPVISPQLAYLLVHILSDEPARWPVFGHPNSLEIGRPFAAKLGWTTQGKDVWAIGSTPYLTIGTWLGWQQPTDSGKVLPQDAAALLHAIAQYASQEQPPDNWPIPPGISAVAVCDPSGMLPTPECPAVVNEIFLAGNEPIQVDTLYRKLQINRQTGLLATAFTPPELIEEGIYLMLPPEAQEWAKLAGLPTIPDQFDMILTGDTPSQDADIAAPEMLAYVRGAVTIRGSAGGANFDRYYLQVGQGLNPLTWIRVGPESRNPVTGGDLGSWDTAGLDGLYALQLLVISTDQQVQTDIVQVTVDNQPPQVEILFPTSGEVIPRSNSPVVLQAEVMDDLALQFVEFSVDQIMISTLTQPPFTITWQGKPGNHTVQVHAVDQAGNENSAELTFTVK
jgi:membrane peptidoglycan carboxypeptidase